MTHEDRHEMIMRSIGANTAYVSTHPEAAKQQLIERGFINEDGTLAERYGGFVVKKKKRKSGA